MSLKSKILITASALIGLLLVVVIVAGVVTLVKNKQAVTKTPTASGTVESGRGPLGPAKIAKSTIPPISRVKVQITKNGFEPAKLNLKINTIIELYNTTDQIAYIASTGQNKLNVPAVFPPSKIKLELPIGYTGSYKLVNQKNSTQTLEILVKN